MQVKNDIEKLMDISNMMAQMEVEFSECQVQLMNIGDKLKKLIK